MLRVFINLLYTHTMPNNHYCGTYMMAYPHLMAKYCLKELAENRDLRHETCPQVSVKVCQFSLIENSIFLLPPFYLNCVCVCSEMQPKTPDYRFNKAQVAIEITQQCDNR